MPLYSDRSLYCRCLPESHVCLEFFGLVWVYFSEIASNNILWSNCCFKQADNWIVKIISLSVYYSVLDVSDWQIGSFCHFGDPRQLSTFHCTYCNDYAFSIVYIAIVQEFFPIFYLLLILDTVHSTHLSLAKERSIYSSSVIHTIFIKCRIINQLYH